ncbi:MAG TPA: DNA repair protein RadA [Candidatus Polarisedimenticolaceae bacterium]|nr:DNA repair protein RadA [Candidatus Polarisedimenticolaceae bacterium]
MAKIQTQYVCQSCGHAQPRWAGRCDSCNAWNSFVETVTSLGRSKTGSAAAAKPEKLGEVATRKLPRIDTRIPEVNQVLGGGIVPGSIMLLSGDPGIGKSTLVLQLASEIGEGQPVLYVSGEESANQIKLRADRLGVTAENLALLSETNIDTIAATIDQGDYKFVIIDSIQTMATDALTGSAGSVGQITVSAQILQRVAKQQHIAMIIIGHVTKEGNIAGPKVLEHLVDVVLYLEGDRYGAFKALRGIKNRFGSTSETGIFEMQEKGLIPVPNPSAALLAERQEAPGSVVLATMEGSRPILVEVQALVARSVFGYPKRTASGFDLNRLNVLVAVLTKRAGINLSDQDIYVNVIGGLKITEPAADLAIILAIASAFHNVPVAHNLIAFGEVGLSGEIRSVSNVSGRLAEAKKLGFRYAVGPSKADTKGVSRVKTISEAVSAAIIKS